METKFIGLDGFDEIETLSNTRSTRNNRTDAQRSSLKRAPQHSASKTGNHKIAKKKAALAVVTSLTAVMLTCVTVASAFGAEQKPEDVKAAVAETTAETTVPLTTAPVNIQTQFGSDTKVCGLYVDGKLIGVARNKAALERALDKVLKDYKEGYDALTTTEFANDVEVKELSDETEAKLTAEELVSLAMDKFSINLATDYIYHEEIDFETEYEYDDEKPASYQKVKTEGKKGLTDWTVRYTFTDGEITDSEITGSEVKQEVVNEVIVIGTKADSSETSDSEASSSQSGGSDSDDSYSYADYTTGSSGSFIWPLPHTHNLTSLFEWRWGRMHNGIDIAGGDDYGQPIIASDSGTVTWSGNDGGGYGNYVVIDHGNGYSTIYGHACELNCVTGQYVSQGETIAFVGSTGNSTGPHLHFEIRINDEPVDPLGYVG